MKTNKYNDELVGVNYIDIITRYKIGIIGIGGAGGNIVDKFAQNYGDENNPIAVDSAKTALSCKKYIKHLLAIGPTVCKGFGCVYADIGRTAARESEDSIKEAIKDFRQIIVIAGLGGGCSSGAAPELIRFAKEMNVITTAIVFVTAQINIETQLHDKIIKIRVPEHKIEAALDSLKTIKELADKLIEINYANEDYKIKSSESFLQFFDRIDRVACNKLMLELCHIGDS